MISDVLFEAGEEIRAYYANYPDVYASVRTDIEAVLHVMDSLRAKLDSPYEDGEHRVDATAHFP